MSVWTLKTKVIVVPHPLIKDYLFTFTCIEKYSNYGWKNKNMKERLRFCHLVVICFKLDCSVMLLKGLKMKFDLENYQITCTYGMVL